MIIAEKRQPDWWNVYTADYPPESNKRLVGDVVKTPAGYFANPRGSQIQSIPCKNWQDAFETVARLAKVTA
jgi:hypothetical protein